MPHPSLRFVEAEDGYSVYMDATNNYVYIADGPGFRRLVSVTELDLAHIWRQIEGGPFVTATRDSFMDKIESMSYDADDYTIEFCESCGMPDFLDEMFIDGDGRTLCEREYDLLNKCKSCEERYPEEKLVVLGSHSWSGNEYACRDCRDCGNFYFCENCDEWDSDIHYHEPEKCDCDPPTLSVTVPFMGGTLHEDDEVEVILEEGVVSETGIQAIRRLLRRHADLAAWDDEGTKYNEEAYNAVMKVHGAFTAEFSHEWKNEQGGYVKRLGKLAYKVSGIKLPSQLLSEIGNLAHMHSQGDVYRIQVTRDLNLSPEDFANEGSCWWTDHNESRCTLKSNGGFGIRSFSTTTSTYGAVRHEYDFVSGRAWVIPLRHDESRDTLRPTFDALGADAYVVFNGYEHMEEGVGARILAAMTGMAMQHITFTRYPSMYVNDNAGYLVGPEDLISAWSDAHWNTLSLHLDEHTDLYHAETEEYADVA